LRGAESKNGENPFALFRGERMTKDSQIHPFAGDDAANIGRISDRLNLKAVLFEDPLPGLKQTEIVSIKKDGRAVRHFIYTSEQL
jgi:hypothetical protein